MALANSTLGNPGAETSQKNVGSQVTMRVFRSSGTRFSQGERYSRRRLGMPGINRVQMGSAGPGRGPVQAGNGMGSDATVAKMN